MPGVGPTLHEFEAGRLHSGSKRGPIVKSRAQAIAIGLDEDRKAGKSVPPRPRKRGIASAIGKALGGSNPQERMSR